MNRKELSEKVNLAYDSYWNNIQYLGNKFGIMPPSPRAVGADPRTSLKAKQLWAEFEHEQQVANDEFAAGHGGV